MDIRSLVSEVNDSTSLKEPTPLSNLENKDNLDGSFSSIDYNDCNENDCNDGNDASVCVNSMAVNSMAVKTKGNFDEETLISENSELKSILLNISEMQFDEEKECEEDENKEFFMEVHDKLVRKIRLNLSDRKKLVELNRIDPIKYSRRNLSRLTGVNPRAITDYKSMYNELCEQSNLKAQRVKKPVDTPLSQFDHVVLKFIDRLREEKKPVTTNMIIAKMIQVRPELKQKKKQTLQKRVYRFLERNNYSIRKASHIGQPLPNKAMDLFMDFFREINRKRHKLGIYDSKEDHDRIVNIDETPIYFEMMSDKTVNKKGAKVISVETKGNERKLISCVLACSAGGKKLMPALIFKGGRDGNLESRYKNLEVVKNKKIVIYFQNNAWCDEYIFKRWVKDVYLVYVEQQMKKKCILIMDRSPSHIYRSKYLDKKGESYVFIPGGLTRYLQPLDIGVNKQFKEHLKDNYLSNLAENIDENNEDKEGELKKYDDVFGDGKKPSQLDEQRLNIINWVIDVWWNDEKIKVSAILNSFHKAGINYPLDGSEDVDFVFPEEVINQNV